MIAEGHIRWGQTDMDTHGVPALRELAKQVQDAANTP